MYKKQVYIFNDNFKQGLVQFVFKLYWLSNRVVFPVIKDEKQLLTVNAFALPSNKELF